MNGGQDTLLPGFVSRPHPSPTNRLLQAKQVPSPVQGSALQPLHASNTSKRTLRSSRRKLAFDQASIGSHATPAAAAKPASAEMPSPPATADDPQCNDRRESSPGNLETLQDVPASNQQSRVASPRQPSVPAPQAQEQEQQNVPSAPNKASQKRSESTFIRPSSTKCSAPRVAGLSHARCSL